MTSTAAAMTPEEFRQWIGDHGYTQETLAVALRQNRTSLYKWLNGKHPVTPIKKLALEQLASGHPVQDGPFDGRALDAWMKEHAFDDELLADAFGVHPLSVVRWRSNRHPITWPMRLALARLASDKRALAARQRARDAQARLKAESDRKIEAARERARAATLR